MKKFQYQIHKSTQSKDSRARSFVHVSDKVLPSAYPLPTRYISTIQTSEFLQTNERLTNHLFPLQYRVSPS